MSNFLGLALQTKDVINIVIPIHVGDVKILDREDLITQLSRASRDLRERL
jgi:hypothetical protein